MTEQEKKLIAGCVKGEKAAWDAFVQKYSNLVYHTIRKTLASNSGQRGNHDIEELYQEFFANLVKDGCKNLSKFRGDNGCSLVAWLVILARRLTIDYLRAQRSPTLEVSDSIASRDPDVLDVLISDEEELALTEALEELEPQDRLVIELHYYRGLAPEESARLLNISVGTFYTRKSRALAKLRELLEKLLKRKKK